MFDRILNNRVPWASNGSVLTNCIKKKKKRTNDKEEDNTSWQAASDQDEGQIGMWWYGKTWDRKEEGLESPEHSRICEGKTFS